MRNLLALLVVICIGVGIFVHRRASASDEIKGQMLQIVDDMDLTGPETAEVKTLIARFHEEAFASALDVSRRLGRKFDTDSYYDEAFRLVNTRLRDEDNGFLADKIDRLKEFHALSVTER